MDAGSEVRFEIEPMDGYQSAGSDEIAGHVRDAVEPAVRAAGAVLEHLKALRPDEVEVRFGIKVSGTANWLVAKAATEGNFEVALTWRPAEHAKAEAASANPPAPGTEPAAAIPLAQSTPQA
jgi:hypothetical protein